jgi:hypothetical protein
LDVSPSDHPTLSDIFPNGVPIPIAHSDRLLLTGKVPTNRVPFEQEQYVIDHLNDLVNRGILESCTRADVDHILRISTRFKKTDPLHPRIVIGARELSKLTPNYPIILPSKTDVQQAAKFNYGCVIDIKDCFYNLPLWEGDRRLFGIHFNNQFYRFLKCPIGSKWSCYICHWATTEIAQRVHPSILVNYDDFLVVGNTISEVVARVDLLLVELARYALPVNWEKSNKVPQQEYDYLSYHVNHKKHSLKVKKSIIQDAQEYLDKFHVGKIKNSQLQSIVGRLEAACGGNNAIMRSLQPIRSKIQYGKNFGNIGISLSKLDFQILESVLAQAKKL